MNILLLEDRGSRLVEFASYLRDLGHEVYECSDIYEACDEWDRKRADCVIADLAMNPDGLSKDEREKTVRGYFSGWVWLETRVLAEPGFPERSIVFSAFVEMFKESSLWKGVQEKYENKVLLLSKNDRDWLSLLEKKLGEIEKRGRARYA